MKNLAYTRYALAQLAERIVPRILSQISRDPTSPLHGCCDRNWWHYKIRDFPSIILQQAAYTTWLAGQMDAFAPFKKTTEDIAAAGCRFWNQRATRGGAFEEYYPWEEGYPPLAFSTLAIMKLVAHGVVDALELEAGATKAAQQLLERFEGQAANQQVAGLAALAWLQKNYPHLVPADQFAQLKIRTLALQREDGWFEEYGGPDLGYLSVTIDCLWDLFDATQDQAYIVSASNALRFIGHFVDLWESNIGMHNARNTDYIVPYGIARFLFNDRPEKDRAASMLCKLYADATSPQHFIQAVDDRYLCHYTGHSLLRCLMELQKLPLAEDDKSAPSKQPHEPERFFFQSGHYLHYGHSDQDLRILLSLKKGGLLTVRQGPAWASDFGWVVDIDHEQFVTQWWSDHWTWSRDGQTFTVRGNLVPYREQISSPLKHFLLRAASYTLGRQLIGKLKKKMIFREAKSSFTFERKIMIGTRAVQIADQITGLPDYAIITEAPRTSKRHVASADSFHPEDLAMHHLVVAERKTNFKDGLFAADTIYTFPSP